MADIITLNGNLLLKTDPTNPNSKLSVSRTDAGATAPLAQIKMFGEGTNNFQGVMAFETMNSGSPNGLLEERMRVHMNGNVGIGTSAPGAKLSINGGLHVGGDSDPGNDNLLVDGDIAISGKHAFRGSDSWLRLNQDKAFTSGVHTPGVFAPMSLNVGGAGSWGDPGRGNVWITGKVGIGTVNPNIHLAIGDSDTGLKQQGDGELAIYTNNKERVRIDKSGNVGIGTIDPKEKLEINGSIRGNRSGALRISTDHGYMDVGPQNRDWSHFYTDRSKYYFNKEIRVSSGKIGSYAEDLSLCTSGTERIRVKTNGNVGIGTTNPKAKLDVNGNINYNRLKKLDVADNFTATVRAADFRLGHSGRRGSPGRALVDNVRTLELNYETDWSDGIRYWGKLSRPSSRKFKDNITNLSSQEAFETLEKLNPVKFNLKADDRKMLHLGFIAEDAPDMVVTPDKEAITNDHIVTVLTKIVKEQQKKITYFNEKMKNFEEKLQYEAST